MLSDLQKADNAGTSDIDRSALGVVGQNTCQVLLLSCWFCLLLFTFYDL